MTYSVKEIFYTLQGEGVNAGKPAIFCRFVGCNLWSGKEVDRAKAICTFCDTQFLGGEKITNPRLLINKISKLWPKDQPNKLVVLTGGEPALQVDDFLVEGLHQLGFEVAIETNGTVELTKGIDWVCVSPKVGTQLKVISGNELKVVYPQKGLDLNQLSKMNFDHFLIQPMDVPWTNDFVEQSVEFCKANTQWKLSCQNHKTLGIR